MLKIYHPTKFSLVHGLVCLTCAHMVTEANPSHMKFLFCAILNMVKILICVVMLSAIIMIIIITLIIFW